MAQLTGHPGAGPAGPTSQLWTTPWPHALGEKARDKDGNEYVFCAAITTNLGDGALVSIDANNQAAPLLNSSLNPTRVGVWRGGTGSAGVDAGWVQIYGVSFVWYKGAAASTDNISQASLAANAGVSVSESDAFGLFPTPQVVVTSPSGTLGLLAGVSDELAESSLVSLSSNGFGAMVNIIKGMFVLTAAQVSNLPDRLFTARFTNTTSPVSAVSNTSGPVTLTSYVSHASGAAIHPGGELAVFLNYPYLEGIRTS